MEKKRQNQDTETIIASNITEQELVPLLIQYIPENKENMTVISLVGGPGSGKSSLAQLIQAGLVGVSILSTDDYVRGDRTFRRKEIEAKNKDPLLEYDFTFMRKQIALIRNLQPEETIYVPTYDSSTGVALNRDHEKEPAIETFQRQIGKSKYLLVEGDFQPLEREEIDLLIYLDVPDDIRLANRVQRDIKNRGGKSKKEIIDNFTFRQKTQTIPHTFPNKSKADIIVSVNAIQLNEPTSEKTYEYRFTLSKKSSMR